MSRECLPFGGPRVCHVTLGNHPFPGSDERKCKWYPGSRDSRILYPGIEHRYRPMPKSFQFYHFTELIPNYGISLGFEIPEIFVEFRGISSVWPTYILAESYILALNTRSNRCRNCFDRYYHFPDFIPDLGTFEVSGNFTRNLWNSRNF